MILILLAAGLAAASLLAGGCGDDTETSATSDDGGAADTAGATSFTLSSTSFASGEEIPEEFACEDEGGSNRSPQLGWIGAPPATASFAVVMDDETPPCGRGDDACMHWSVFNIPAGVDGFDEGEDTAAIAGVALGRNYTGANGYAGPCPPESHVYRITIYALDGETPLVKTGEAYTRSSFETEFATHILGSDTLEGSFTP